MRPSSQPSSSLSFQRLMEPVIILIVSGIIFIAIWLAGAAIMENIQFGKATDQILDVIANTRILALRDTAFAQQPGDDVFARLTHAGLLPVLADDAVPHNPWNLPVRARISDPGQARFESDLPVRDCRRIALFFFSHIKELGIKLMDARGTMDGLPRQFYNAAQSQQVFPEAVDAACGSGPYAILGLVYSVR